MHERLKQILDAERRIELINGRVQVGGTQAMTRLVLQQLLAQASLAELRDLGADGWHDAAQLALELPPLPTGNFDHRRHYSLLQRVSLPLFEVLGGSALITHSRDIAVRLGSNVLTPDVFVGHTTAMREYYLDGPPLLAVEIIDPYNPVEELERLGLYLASGTPEVWWLEPAHGHLQRFSLRGGRYTLQTHASGWVESTSVVGLALCLDNAWQPGWRPSLGAKYRGKTNESPGQPTEVVVPPAEGRVQEKPDAVLSKVLASFTEAGDETQRGGYPADMPFSPKIGLAPQPVGFEAFISWTTEAKFEAVDDRLVIGSERGNYELLGLLLTSVGLIEAFLLLGAEVKAMLRGVN